MKIVILLFILTLFICFGLFFYLKYLYRIHIFQDILYIVKYLKNNIVFTKSNLNTLINECCSNIHNITKKFFVNDIKLNNILCKEDDDLLKRYFCSMGNGDVEYEINNLSYYENIFLERYEFHKKNKANGVLYFKLIIGVGLLVVILLF